VGAVACAAALGAAWWAFAPPTLAGRTSITVVDGTSMLPRFHRGDLAVVRQASRFAAGDVAAYRSRLLYRVVLHRIVKVQGDRYVFKGDNNSWLDPETPSHSQLVGKLWVRVPRAGIAVNVARTPVTGALLTVLLVLVLGLGGQRRGPEAP
jgi:signal peptidase I